MARIVLKSLLWFCGIYCGILAVTLGYDYAFYARGSFDTYRDFYTGIYAKPNVAAVYGLDHLKPRDHQILILGSSDAGRGYDADEIAAHLPPGTHVDKLALSGSNINMYRGLVSDLKEQGFFERAAARGLMVVLPGNPLVFLDNEQQFGGSLNDLEVEKLRHKLYSAGENGTLRPCFHSQVLMNISRFALIKPFVWLYGLKAHGDDFISSAFLDFKHLFAPPKLNPAEHMKQTTLRMVGEKGLAADQFAALKDFVGELRAMGVKVIYFDVPLHSVLRHDYPPLDQYEAQIRPLVAELDLPYYSLQDFASDEQFSDHVHAKPEYKKLWSAKLAEIIGAELKKD